jgi:LEA14-like dessication related protein
MASAWIEETDMTIRIPFLNRLFPFVALLALLSGCVTLRAAPPEIALVGLQVENLTLSHAILTADLSLFNPNDFSINVREVRYQLAINNIQVAQGLSLDGVRLGARQYGQLPLRLSTSYFNLLRLGPLLEQSKPLPYKISGDVILGRFLLGSRSLPFSKKGTLDLSGITDEPVEANTTP